MNCRALLTALTLTGLVHAQTPPAPPGGGDEVVEKKADEGKGKSNAKIDQRAEKMRDEITKGKPVKSHVKVRVRLKNGNRLVGVVKDGRLVERVDGLRFVDAQAKERGAGIRLWYSGGTRNYVFVPFRDLKDYEVLQRLSHQQLMELEHELQMAEKRAEEREAARARRAKGDAEAGDEAAKATGKPETLGEAPAAPAGGATDPTQQKKADAAAALQKAKEAQWQELLAKYPPKDGWNTARRDEIKRRRVVIGAVPSEVEQAFVDQFDEWLKACVHAGLDPDAASAPSPSPREQRKARRPGR